MDFQFTEYQLTVASAVADFARRFGTVPAKMDTFHLYDAAIDAEIERSGFHDVMRDADLSAIGAVCVISEFAKLPSCVEIMASVLVRPALDLAPDFPRPLALVELPDRPVRFLPQARAALVFSGNGIDVIQLAQGDVAELDSLFAYPYGRLSAAALGKALPLKIDAAKVADIRRLWQIGIAAEICGALDGALTLTIDYVTQRQQFGKPLGTLQAIQHRLAEVAVTLHAVKWLAYRAASSGDAEHATTACAYAQESARQAAYDLHQFHGATGMTLEYPLHLWTYRLKALLGELGGAGTQNLQLADQVWGCP